MCFKTDTFQQHYKGTVKETMCYYSTSGSISLRTLSLSSAVVSTVFRLHLTPPSSSSSLLTPTQNPNANKKNQRNHQSNQKLRKTKTTSKPHPSERTTRKPLTTRVKAAEEKGANCRLRWSAVTSLKQNLEGSSSNSLSAAESKVTLLRAPFERRRPSLSWRSWSPLSHGCSRAVSLR